MHVKQIGMSLEKHKYIVPSVSHYENRIIGKSFSSNIVYSSNNKLYITYCANEL